MTGSLSYIDAVSLHRQYVMLYYNIIRSKRTVSTWSVWVQADILR